MSACVHQHLQTVLKPGMLISIPNSRGLPMGFLDRKAASADLFFDNTGQDPVVLSLGAPEGEDDLQSWEWRAATHMRHGDTMEDPKMPVFFCRVVKPSTAAEKTLIPNMSAGVILARHRILHVDFPASMAHVSTRSHLLASWGRAEVLTREACVHIGVQALRSKTCVWDVKSTGYALSYLPPSLTLLSDISIAQAMVTELALADATPHGGGLYILRRGDNNPDDQRRWRVADILRKDSLLEMVPVDGDRADHCKLTPKGMVVLEPFYICGTPKRLVTPGDIAAKANWTRFQVLSFLETDGWECAEKPRRGELGGEPFRFSAGSRKVWYATKSALADGKVCMKYLLCLASHVELAERGDVHEIPHFRSAKFYADILAGRVVGAPCCRR